MTEPGQIADRTQADGGHPTHALPAMREEVVEAELLEDEDALPALRPPTTTAARYVIDKHTVLAPGELPATTADQPRYSEADFRISEQTAERRTRAGTANTRVNRGSVAKAFHAWCEQEGRIAVPCTTATFTEYGTHLMAQGHKATTIEAYMSHVMAVQPRGDRPDPSIFRENLSTYRGENPRANRVRRALPLQLPHVVAMAAACDERTGIGMRDAALLVLGYRFLARRIEVADLLIEDLTISQSSVTVYLPKDKTHQDEDQEIVLHDHPDLRLLPRLHAWLGYLHTLGVTRGPLFRALTKKGTLASRHHATARGHALSGNAVNEIVKQRFRQAALDSRGLPVSSRGLRAGGATDLAEAKVRGRDLNAAGRWTENSRIPEAVYVRPARDRAFDPFAAVRLSQTAD
ncbi:integrase [Kitasatospora sp. NPDC097643]|uniref:integrase n=1 Tax=Kitasatospora sp. NPDC097643 TaxID=3157230 RepID=UPI003330510D